MAVSIIPAAGSLRDTLDINQDRRVVDIADKIHLLEPNRTPLTVFLSKLRKSKAINPKFQWLEDVLYPWTTLVVTSGLSAGDTAIAVTTGTGAYFKANDIIVNPTDGETMKVTSVATDTLTVVRSWGTVAAGTLTTGDELHLLGNAAMEGDSRPTIKTTKTTTAFNYTQIFRTPFGATRTETQSELYGGNDRNYLRRKGLIDHLAAMERAFWFGEKVENTSDNQPRRTTGGFFEYATTNVTTLGSAGLTEATWEDFLRTGFRYGSDTKIAFCSPLGIQKLNSFALNDIETVPGAQTFGVNVHKYISAHGMVMLVNTLMFGDSGTYDEYIALVDMENIGMKTMQDTVLRQNIQAPDIDGWEDEYLTEAGLVVRMEKTHSVLKNVGGSAVT